MSTFEKIAKTLEKILNTLLYAIGVIGVILAIWGFIAVFFGNSIALFIIGGVLMGFSALIKFALEECSGGAK